jgi:RHS repeat-associated protein
LQGDVVKLINASGTTIANYAYSAYGEIISITDANGTAITSSTHVANINPLRYRGYYYDAETGFYYLQSRYYDPVIGRFINADSMAGTGQGLIGYNMFAYCGNNPTNRCDESGAFWKELAEAFVTVTVACVVVAAAAVITIGTGGGAALALAGGGAIASALPAVATAATVGAAASAAGACVAIAADGSITNSNDSGRIDNDVLDLEREGSALKTDPDHAFPDNVDNYVGNATQTAISNGTLYQIDGALNGIAGRFEWIVQAGKIVHRFFVRGGTMNGIPIIK